MEEYSGMICCFTKNKMGSLGLPGKITIFQLSVTALQVVADSVEQCLLLLLQLNQIAVVSSRELWKHHPPGSPHASWQVNTACIQDHMSSALAHSGMPIACSALGKKLQLRSVAFFTFENDCAVRG